jgi:hypothetical protein
VAREECGHALGPQALGVGGAWVALQERERDRAVDGGEHACSAGPEAIKLGSELVGDRDARFDEVFAAAGQCTQRAGVVAVGAQRPEAMCVGARELGEHVRVEAVALAPDTR